MALSGQTVISDLDKTLKQLFQSEFGTSLPFDLSFAIPDKNFTPVSKTHTTLDCYLYEINEDRGGTSDDMCSFEALESIFGKRHFATATLKFKSLSRFVNHFRESRDYAFVWNEQGTRTTIVDIDPMAVHVIRRRASGFVR